MYATSSRRRRACLAVRDFSTRVISQRPRHHSAVRVQTYTNYDDKTRVTNARYFKWHRYVFTLNACINIILQYVLYGLKLLNQTRGKSVQELRTSSYIYIIINQCNVTFSKIMFIM